MRGPDVILREGFNEDGNVIKKKKKNQNVQNVLGENSVVGRLKWVVSGLGGGELLSLPPLPPPTPFFSLPFTTLLRSTTDFFFFLQIQHPDLDL